MLTFAYEKPNLDEIARKRHTVWLGTTDRLFATIQAHREGGEVKLHAHTHLDGFWFVLAGRVRFYCDETSVCADLGARQGVIIPRGEKYWFEAYGPEELEIFQIECSDKSMSKDEARSERAVLGAGAHATRVAAFEYAAPAASEAGGCVPLTRTDLLFAGVDVLGEGVESAGPQRHESLDGVWYVLDGRARFTEGESGEAFELGPQQGVLVPRGETYRLANAGGGALHILKVLCSSRQVRDWGEMTNLAAAAPAP
jgi:mannose-6-phosphate isomerase-like protein (cupin superfamily)